MGEQYIGSTRIFSLQNMGELLEKGIPLDSVDKDGKTFLRHACGDGKSDIVQFLLDRGANPNSRDHEGKTPLMAAAMIGRLEIVELLVEHGADPTVETPSGDSAVKIAQRWGKKVIEQTLLGRTAREFHPHAVPQGLVRPTSGGRQGQASCAPAQDTGLKPRPQVEGDILPLRISSSRERVVQREVIQAVVRQETESESELALGQPRQVEVISTVVDVKVTETDIPGDQSSFKMPELTTDEYIQALETMKQSPNDRIGILGSLGATGLGVATGTAAAGTIAAALGATTLLGSSMLGSVLGGALIMTTPVGWVIGSAVAAGAIGYGVSKLIRSGARADVIKETNIKDLIAEIEERKAAAEKTGVPEEKFKVLVESLQLLVKNNRISQTDCTELLAGVEKGTISYEYACGTVDKLSQEEEVRTDDR